MGCYVEKEMQSLNKINSNLKIAVTMVSTLYFVLFAYGAYLTIQPFEKIFVSFKAELPLQTSLLIDTYRYWGILSFISAYVLYKVCKGEGGNFNKLLTFLFILTILLVPFAIWGIWSPVLDGSGQSQT